MPTGIVASRNEFLTNAAIDYSKKLADENNYVGATGFLPQVEVTSRTFQYEKFDPSTYVRYQAGVSPYESTKTRNKNPALVSDSIEKEYRFGAAYVPADVEANGSEDIVRLRRTYESTRISSLDYEVAINSILQSGTQSGAATAIWGTGASDPVADLRAAAAAIGLGLIPNKVIISLPAKRALMTDTTFRNYVKGSSNNGMINDVELSEALGAIFGSSRPVEVKTANAVYNSAQLNTANTYTEARAILQSSVVVFYGGDGEDPFEPAAFKEFYLPSEEGVFESGDPDGDEARNMKVVTRKLVRKTNLTSDVLAYRITGVV